MEEPFVYRAARASDAEQLLAIYRPFVEQTAVSFELEAPSLHEFSARITKALAGWHWLVAEHDGQCLGYAYGSMHRDRPAYRWSVEVSAYVHQDYRRKGVGKALYLELFSALAARGFCRALAGVTLPNEASVALHSSVGFTPVGTFAAVGRKFDAWHDVSWFQRKLRDLPPRQGRP
jgi:L-amino acid N-acyltransferase YncA